MKEQPVVVFWQAWWMLGEGKEGGVKVRRVKTRVRGTARRTPNRTQACVSADFLLPAVDDALGWGAGGGGG